MDDGPPHYDIIWVGRPYSGGLIGAVRNMRRRVESSDDTDMWDRRRLERESSSDSWTEQRLWTGDVGILDLLLA